MIILLSSNIGLSLDYFVRKGDLQLKHLKYTLIETKNPTNVGLAKDYDLKCLVIYSLHTFQAIYLAPKAYALCFLLHDNYDSLSGA